MLIFLYNFHREHSLLKFVKKIIAENQCEKNKNYSIFTCLFNNAPWAKILWPRVSHVLHRLILGNT